jgi:hypothetical protein
MAQTSAGPPPGAILAAVSFAIAEKSSSAAFRRHHSATHAGSARRDHARDPACRGRAEINNLVVLSPQAPSFDAFKEKSAHLADNDPRPQQRAGCTRNGRFANTDLGTERKTARLSSAVESFPTRACRHDRAVAPEDRRQHGGEFRSGHSEIPLGPRQETGGGRFGFSPAQGPQKLRQRLRRRLRRVKPSPSAATRRPVSVPASAMEGSRNSSPRRSGWAGASRCWPRIATGPAPRPHRRRCRSRRAHRDSDRPRHGGCWDARAGPRRNPAGHGDAPRRGTGSRSPAPAARGSGKDFEASGAAQRPDPSEDEGRGLRPLRGRCGRAAVAPRPRACSPGARRASSHAAPVRNSVRGTPATTGSGGRSAPASAVPPSA